jgi:hypothetical protein|tara:strand:- start:345 stop:479 length:135 start_codon:yes stop_codon:yes gene_type:complete
MIKKIFIFLFVAILLSSCGKKNDPVYNEKNQNSEIIGTQINTFS